MSASVTVRHNFETAHRLPHLPGKCQSLHGHSWWVDVTVAGAPGEDGLLVEFGPFKRALRTWIDTFLDHGVVLGALDPLTAVLPSYDTKVYELPTWPTVEALAAHLAEVAADTLAAIPHAPGARVTDVLLRETHVNAAGWHR